MLHLQSLVYKDNMHPTAFVIHVLKGFPAMTLPPFQLRVLQEPMQTKMEQSVARCVHWDFLASMLRNHPVFAWLVPIAKVDNFSATLAQRGVTAEKVQVDACHVQQDFHVWMEGFPRRALKVLAIVIKVHYVNCCCQRFIQ